MNSEYPETPVLFSEDPKKVVLDIPQGNCISSSVFLDASMRGLFRRQVTVEPFGSQRMSAIGESTQKVSLGARCVIQQTGIVMVTSNLESGGKSRISSHSCSAASERLAETSIC